MPIIKKRILDNGDDVLIRGEVYRAVLVEGGTCESDCALYNHGSQRCPGCCFRYEMPPEMFLKYLGDADNFPKQKKLIVSTTTEEWDNAINRARK